MSLFINLSHPSEVGEKHHLKQIRSFTAKYNERRKRLKSSSSRKPTVHKPCSQVDKILPQQSNLDAHLEYRIVSSPSLKLCGDSLYSSQSVRALEFYIVKLGPNAGWSTTYCNKCSSETFKNYLVQMTLNDPLLLEAILAYSEMSLDGVGMDSGQLKLQVRHSKAILYHRGNFFKILLERLNANATIAEFSTLFAIITMIALDSTASDWPAYSANVAGIQNLLARQGGLAGLKYQCFFRTQFTWAHLRLAANQHSTAISGSRQECWASCYPEHPYPPSLCQTITKLPIGLQELALSSLSTNVIDLLADMSVWTLQFDSNANEACQHHEYYATGMRLLLALAEILNRYAMKPSEEILCIGVYAFINSTDGRTKSYRQPRGIEHFLVGIDKLAKSSSMGDVLLWAAIAIAANNDPISWDAESRWYLLDRYLDRMDALHNWGDVLVILRRFFWTIALEETWRGCWKMALQRRVDRRAVCL